VSDQHPDPLSRLAAEAFGVPYLYPIQRFVISNVLEGSSQVVVLPTGAGKSLCFQLPALLLPGPTLVLMPLLSLLADQARRLAEAKIPSGTLRGGLTREEKETLFARLRCGELRLLLATPEACLVPGTVESLRSCRIAHLVVDEAHCIAEWGDAFRPAYRAVGDVARALGAPTVSAFTATASAPVIARIRGSLAGDAEMRVVSASADRPNIHYAVRPVLSRMHELVRAAATQPRPMLVFCRTRTETERAARALLHRLPDIPCRFYHAGLTREERAAVESWFMPSGDGVLFATCAYGMGVDKANIRTIMHADVPYSIEAYLQESGRAGRDGADVDAILLVSAEDDAFGAKLGDDTERQRYAAMLGYARARGRCRRNALLGLVGQEPVACSGCDVCAGTAAARPEGEAEIVALVRRHPRRWAPAQAASVLCAEPGPRARRGFLDAVPGWGALSGWTTGDVEEGIRALLAAGSLRLRARAPWKGTLTVGRPLGRRSPGHGDPVLRRRGPHVPPLSVHQPPRTSR
jgi:ATP-dependent DNA helicase RecQ